MDQLPKIPVLFELKVGNSYWDACRLCWVFPGQFVVTPESIIYHTVENDENE